MLHAEAYEVKILMYLIAERIINAIASVFCGIVPIKVLPKLVTANVGSHIHVSFSLHDERVIDICRKQIQFMLRDNHLRKNMEAATNVTGAITGLRRVKYACQIG